MVAATGDRPPGHKVKPSQTEFFPPFHSFLFFNGRTPQGDHSCPRRTIRNFPWPLCQELSWSTQAAQEPQLSTDKATWGQQKLKEAGGTPTLFPCLCREPGPAHTWISDTGLWSCERTKFCCVAICHGSRGPSYNKEIGSTSQEKVPQQVKVAFV